MKSITIFDQSNLQIKFIEDKEKQTLWTTQKQIAELFGVGVPAISKHLNNIFESSELTEKAVVSKMEITASDNKKYQATCYNLDAVIAVGYRVNSKKATEFRKWSTQVVKKFVLDGFVIDAKRAKSEEIAKQLRKLRVEEKEFYRVIRDVFKVTATDYDSRSQDAKLFFAIAQDKFLFAVTEKVSSAIILERCNAHSKNLGLQTFAGKYRPTLADVKISKNYLNAEELEELEMLCENFIIFCQLRTFRKQLMTLEEIMHKASAFLEFNGYKVLYSRNYNTSRKRADTHAITQHQLYKKLK
jgi:hypothetical protein